MKKKIVTIVGTRPEIIRLSSIIIKLEKNFNHILVNTNQNFDRNLNSIFFNNFKIKKPKYNMLNSEKNAFKFLGKMFDFIDNILKKENPDAILVLGDTNSSLSSYVAKKKKYPNISH